MYLFKPPGEVFQMSTYRNTRNKKNLYLDTFNINRTELKLKEVNFIFADITVV